MLFQKREEEIGELGVAVRKKGGRGGRVTEEKYPERMEHLGGYSLGDHIALSNGNPPVITGAQFRQQSIDFLLKLGFVQQNGPEKYGPVQVNNESNKLSDLCLMVKKLAVCEL